MVISSISHASVIETNDSIIIMINPPLANGTSINTHPAELFNKGKKIKIIADSSRNGAIKTNVDKVLLNIINAPLYINTSIAVVGASKLQISASKGLTCDGCSLYGADSITIVTGNGYSYNGIIGAYNNLNISSGGMLAPGVNELNLLSGYINIAGKVSTNVTTPSGDVAYGLLRIIGNDSAKYNMSDYALVTSTKWGRVIVQDGSQIRAAKIQISSPSISSMSIGKSIISTQSYLRAVGAIGEKNVLWDGSIDVFSGGLIDSAAQFFAESDISIKAGSSAIYKAESLIEARGDVHLIAATNIQQLGEVSASSVNIAANNLTNEGDVFSQRRLFVSTTDQIINQFGGRMLSDDDVILLATTLTNGSVRPYRLINSPSARSLVYNEGNIYDYNVFNDPLYRRQAVNSLEALIFARNIEIKTKVLINTNPAYYLVKNKDIPLESAVLKRGFHPQAIINYTNSGNVDELTQNEIIPNNVMQQVGIIAMDNLLVNATERVDNASAILEATFGNMAITTNNLTNQRHIIELWNHTNVVSVSRHENYEIRTIQIGEYTFSIRIDLGPDTSSVTRKNEIYAMFNSPTGRIHVGNNLIVNASGGLVNKNSVIEVAGNFDANFSSFLHAGIGLNITTNTETTSYHEEEYCSRRIFRKCVSHKTKYWTTMVPTINDDRDTTMNRFRSIYAVNGAILGKGRNNVEMKTIFVNK